MANGLWYGKNHPHRAYLGKARLARFTPYDVEADPVYIPTKRGTPGIVILAWTFAAVVTWTLAAYFYFR